MAQIYLVYVPILLLSIWTPTHTEEVAETIEKRNNSTDTHSGDPSENQNIFNETVEFTIAPTVEGKSKEELVMATNKANKAALQQAEKNEVELLDYIYDEKQVIDTLIDTIYDDDAYYSHKFMTQKHKAMIVGAACGSIIMGLVAILLIVRCRRVRSRAQYRGMDDKAALGTEKEPLYTDYSDI